jgi:hypothetical protein
MDNPVIHEYGEKFWYDSNGKFHRDDGPAVIYADGDKAWYQHGKFHRDDGPAVEYADGDKFWYQHDKRHRYDGPAVEHADGTNEWWLNDELLTFEEWLDKVNMSDEDKVMMKLQYG